MRILCLCSALTLSFFSAYGSCTGTEKTHEPIALKAGPHLLLDDYLIATSQGIERKVMQPQRFLVEPIVTGRPEHQNWQPFLTVIHYPDAPAEKRFRMWYNADVVDDPTDGRYAGVMAHLTSADGIHWAGPYERLNTITWDGYARFGAAVLDDGPGYSPASERFKIMFSDAGGKRNGPRVAFSPDGIKWTMHNGGKPILPVNSGDDIWTPFHDPIRQRYFLIGKTYEPYTWTNAEGRIQTKSLRLYFDSYSRDFKTWSERKGLVFAPDEKDTGITQWYGPAGFQVRGDLIVGFLRVLHDERTTKGAPEEAIAANNRGYAGLGANEFGKDGGAGMGYTVLTWTRDGETWHRDRHTDPYFEPDPRVGAWDHAMSWVSSSTPVGDELYLYYAGYRWGHKYHHSVDRQIGLVKTKRDRFVARKAGAEGGKLTTPLVTLAGDKITLNADAANGEIRVQVLDADGKPIPGFSLADCKPITVDSLNAEVEWKTPLASLRGQEVRLEFALKNASLFAFEIE